MTFREIVGRSSHMLRGLSKKKKDQHRKRKRLNTSSQYRPTKNVEDSREQKSSLHPPSSMTLSDLSRSISNGSITFASVFDEPNNRTTFDPDQSLENEDLVIVVPNKYVLDEPIVNNSNIEPYPFRSENPFDSLLKSHSSASINRSVRSKRKFLHHHRAKQLKTINPSIDRSKSTPNLLPPASPISTTTGHSRPLKTIREWFKSSSVGRLIQSFIKHPTETTQPIPCRKSSDFIY